jgi:excisionase family DNA binding protein
MCDEIIIKTEYRTIEEIAQRLGRGKRAAARLIKRKGDPLPVKKVGRDYWMSEAALQKWLGG